MSNGADDILSSHPIGDDPETYHFRRIDHRSNSPPAVISALRRSDNNDVIGSSVCCERTSRQGSSTRSVKTAKPHANHVTWKQPIPPPLFAA